MNECVKCGGFQIFISIFKTKVSLFVETPKCRPIGKKVHSELILFCLFFSSFFFQFVCLIMDVCKMLVEIGYNLHKI